MKEWLEKLKALIAEAEAAMNDANKEGADDAAKATAMGIYKAKTAAIGEIKAKIAQAKELAEHRKALAEAEELQKTVVAGKTIPTVPATAADHDKEEAERVEIFTDFVCGKNMSDVARDTFQPKSTGWKKAMDGGGIVIPRTLASKVLPESRIVGKALPLTSVQASPANLFQAEMQKQLNMYPGEAAALFPRTFKVPTRSGSVIFPELVQGAPGAEDSADEFNEYGAVACAWTAEGAEKPGTEPSFSQKTLPTFELSAKTELSRTLLNRSVIDIEALLGQLFRASILHKIDLAVINGNGVGKPTGILQAAGIAAPARTTGGAVKYDDLVNLEYAIAPQFRAAANWVLADGAARNLALQKDTAGRPLFIAQTDPASKGAKLGNISGYEAIPTQRTTLGAAGDVIFGDLSQYVCPVEQEVVMLRSEHEKMSKGVIVFVIFVQVGGKVMQVRAFSKLPV